MTMLKGFMLGVDPDIYFYPEPHRQKTIKNLKSLSQNYYILGSEIQNTEKSFLLLQKMTFLPMYGVIRMSLYFQKPNQALHLIIAQSILSPLKTSAAPGHTPTSLGVAIC